jgi:hypothetical protein
MKFLFGVTLIFIVLIECEGFGSKLFSADVLIDREYDFTDECKKALNKTKYIYEMQRCLIDTCEKYDCFYAREDERFEDFCKYEWGGICCNTRLLGRLCSKEDQKFFEEKISKKVDDLEKETCGNWTRKSFDCNGSDHMFGNTVLINIFMALIFCISKFYSCLIS